MPKSPSSGSGNPRGRGTYNPACDVCARKKTKCDGHKPICEPCRGRAGECTWTKNPARKRRIELDFEAMNKSIKERTLQWRKYADYLECELDKCPHRSGEFRSSRPPDTDGLPGDPAGQELDFTTDDGNSESGDGPVKELCIPTQTLQLKENGFLHHYVDTAPFRFEDAEPLPLSIQALQFPATYVLLTEDDPDDHFNPDFDWSRHLPDIVPMNRRTHDEALDLLFKFFASWCLRIVPELFLRDMYRALYLPSSHPPPNTPHYSPMLHNALVAVALAFVDDPKLLDLKTRQHFVDKAKSYMEVECNKPNPSLSVVNALSILASFHSSKGDQTLSFLNFGNSGRMAQVWLNVDCSDWVKSGSLNKSDLLERRWTYWTTFAQDVCWSLYVDRESFMSSPTTTKDFKATSESLVDEAYDQLPWAYPLSKLEPQPNYLTKTFQATCELLMIGRRIMDAVYTRLDRFHSRRCALDELVIAIDLDLHKWREGLSPELYITHETQQTATPHKLMMHLTYWWLLILLHRPFFQRKGQFIHNTDGRINSVERCRIAAENIMQLLLTWRRLYSLRYCPIDLLQVVYSAGTVYLLTSVQAKTSTGTALKELAHSERQQELVLQYLNEIGKSWQCANIVADMLKSKRSEAQLHCRTALISPSQSVASHAPEFAIDDDDDDSSSSSVPLSKGQGRRSRNRSTNHSSNPPPTLRKTSLSLDNTTYCIQQDVPSFSPPSSHGSIPITIQVPSNSDSHLASSLFKSFSSGAHSVSLHRFNLPGSSSASLVAPSPTGSPHVSSTPSDSTSFFQSDPNISGYGQAIAHPLPVLDELIFTGSDHIAGHLFQQSSALFNTPQELEANLLSQPYQFDARDHSMSGGMLSEGTLATGPNFTVEPPSPELIFQFDSPQTSTGADGFINYDSPAGFEDFPVNRHGDTAMNDGTTWPINLGETEIAPSYLSHTSIGRY